MRKKFFIALFLLLNVFVYAQKRQNCLLWEVSGNGLSQPSYIFGTIHIILKDDFFFYDLWKKKFKTCDKLVLEADLDMDLKEQLAIVNQMKLKNDSVLTDYMSQDEAKAFESYFLDSLQISKSHYNLCLTYMPFFSYSVILNDVVKGKKMFYEKYLTKLAKKNKMDVIGLETMEYQMSLVTDIPVVEQIDMFLFDYDKDKQTNLKDDYLKLVNLYKRQDLQGMLDLQNEEDSDTAFVDIFLNNRNKSWIPQLIKFFKEGPTFVAVGSAHLSGFNGVLQLLENQGYTVKPVCP